MTLEKLPAIVELLRHVGLQDRGWIVVDNWDADLAAVGIAVSANPQHLVYVSCFGQPPGSYFFSCEEAPSEPKEFGPTVREGVVHGYDELLEVLTEHLGTESR